VFVAWPQSLDGMINMGNSKAKQRFVKLDVGEVSLVDAPANEAPFIVVKSQGASDMSEKTAATPETPAAAAPAATTAPVAVAATPAAPDGGEVAVLKGLVEKLTATVTEFTAQATKAKEPAPEVEGQMSLTISPDGSVIVNGQPVAKGKTFTPARKATLKAVLSETFKMLADVDQDTAKSFLEETAKGMGGSYSQGVTPQGTGNGGHSVTKAEDVEAAVTKAKGELEAKHASEIAEVKKSLDEARAQITKQGEEIAVITKARAPGNAAGDGAGGTDKPVEKSAGMWNGVL
jgi:hypothetical protein